MKQELLARLFVITLSLAAIAIPVAIHLTRDELEIHARQAESGGWDPDVIHAGVGQPLHLHLTSDDVMHGFGVGQTDFDFVDIEPGKWIETTLIFNQPGTYTFFCTRWCGLNHWRMRGTIEVDDAGDTSQPAGQPLYETLGIDIDAPHLSPLVPQEKPSAERGANELNSIPNHLLFQSTDYYRSHSPYQLYEELQPVNLTDAQRWDVVAAIWRANITPSGLEQGRQLFTQNCAACHGQNGAGDGVFADDLNALGIAGHADDHGFKKPADFTNSESMLGASPAQLQGKILRGGMGTGMPMWGVIFTEPQIWNIIGYLYTFSFTSSP